MITITGWGAFWLGLFSFLIFCELVTLLKLTIKVWCVSRVIKRLSKNNPEVLKHFKINL